MADADFGLSESELKSRQSVMTNYSLKSTPAFGSNSVAASSFGLSDGQIQIPHFGEPKARTMTQAMAPAEDATDDSFGHASTWPSNIPRQNPLVRSMTQGLGTDEADDANFGLATSQLKQCRTPRDAAMTQSLGTEEMDDSFFGLASAQLARTREPLAGAMTQSLGSAEVDDSFFGLASTEVKGRPGPLVRAISQDLGAREVDNASFGVATSQLTQMLDKERLQRSDSQLPEKNEPEEQTARPLQRQASGGVDI